MVWDVCRRTLRDHHDAEDAFQATFLVLASKAASVKPREKLGNWLYGVAYLTAKKARATRARRRVLDHRAREAKAREAKVPDTSHPGADRPDRPDELLPALDQELSRLPDKYRAPVVLCELEGRTHKEAAEQLGWPIGTVSGRLARARALLAMRLSRRRAAVSTGSLAALLAETASAAGVPPTLVGPTVRAASLLSAGRAATGAVSAEVAALTGEVMKAMFLSKMAVASVLLGLAGLGGGGVYYCARAAATATAAPSARAGPAAVDNGAPGAETTGARKPSASPATLSADDAAKLQGTWKAVAIESDGKTLGREAIEVKDLRFAIEGGVLTIPGVDAETGKRADGGGPTRRKRFALGASASPKEIDLTSLDGRERGETTSCIYKLEGGRLTICFPPADRPRARPKEFRSAAGSGTVVFVLERQKDE
jgi:RNA polymerase sigma-70 factor (ECF subfamily)